MASSLSTTFLLSFFIVSTLFCLILSASVIEDLKNLNPPKDFNTTIINNCLHNPSLRYCPSSSSPMDLNEIFKSTIVASHLCNESNNPNCIESFPKIDLRGRPKIALLYLSFNFFWKYCPLTILSIDLSNSFLKGNFPTEVFLCTQIQALDLSHNDLSGDVPIQCFSDLSNLTLLNLSFNHFSESKISDTQFFKRFNSSSFLHSGLLPNRHKFKIKAVVLLIGFPMFVILIVGCLGWSCLRRPDLLPQIFWTRKLRFTPSMLKAATEGFSEKNLVGKSDGVEIYKGILRENTEVRIEIYKDSISRENRRKFVEECKVLVELCHKNLVKVLGWCDNRKMRAIVTEWTDGDTIETWLSESVPPWKHRLKILMGIVEGMCYLHEEWPDIGYDLRTSSLLLSNDHEPLISRFRVGDIRNRNTRNIYKLGIFMLEMITNRRPREEFERGEAGFVESVRTHYPENVEKVIDERMKIMETTLDQAKQGIGLGLICTDQSSSRQPPRLDQISNMITRVYQQSSNYQKSHGNRGNSKGHKRMQSIL